MPKVVTAGHNWQSVPVTGDFAHDEAFKYLSLFEELIPEEVSKSKSPKLTKKKEKMSVKKKKRVLLEKSDASCEKRKVTLLTKKKERKAKSQDRNVIENGNSPNEEEATVSAEVMEENDLNDGSKKLSKKASKRKATSNTQIQEEKTAKKSRLRENSGSVIDGSNSNDLILALIAPKGLFYFLERTGLTAEATLSNSDSFEDDLPLWQSFYLPTEVLKALKDLRFLAPTEIQSLVLPSAVRDQLDILGAAETGSGKTLAFVIPLVCRLLDSKLVEEKAGPKALILAPTRELVMQIRKQLDSLLKYTPFRAVQIVGGLSQQKQERLLKYCPSIVVATPGRFWALAEAAAPGTYLSDWSQIQVVVVDEADRMVEKGHFEELERIFARIKETNRIYYSKAPEKRQTMVFSATLTFVHLPSRRMDDGGSEQTSTIKLRKLVETLGMRKQRKIFDITKPSATPETLLETRMNCSDLKEKDSNVLYLLTRYPGRTLIFTNSIDASRRLHNVLSKLLPTRILLILHARMIQKQRLKNFEKFSGSANAIMIATDVASRGLDIPNVQHVIHYQVSKTAESYVHRSGRTARVSQKGLTVLMVDPQDVRYYSRICRNLKRKKDLPIFPVDYPDLMSLLKERVKASIELESLEHRIKKISSHESWFTKAAREADLVDERYEEKEFTNSELTDLRRQQKSAEFRLKKLLAEKLPDFDRQHYLKTRYITPDVVSKYESSSAKDALASFEEHHSYQESMKKRFPKRLSLRQISKLSKRKRKKLKRK